MLWALAAALVALGASGMFYVFVNMNVEAPSEHDPGSFLLWPSIMVGLMGLVVLAYDILAAFARAVSN